MNSASLRSLRGVLLSGVLAALLPRGGRAESSVSFKHEDYRESGGRIVVKTDGAYVQHDFGPASQLKLEGILDAITGASPNGQPAPRGSDQVPLSAPIHERRKAWSASFAHQFSGAKLAVGAANSRESDYVSTGWSLNSTWDFNQKNTTVLLGLAGTDDEVKVFHQTAREKKRTKDAIVGLTQLLDPLTSVTLNLSWGRQRGYLSDPYKLVLKTTEIFTGVFLPVTFPENRPAEREKWIALANLNRALPALHGTLDLAYRFYHDTFGTRAHTFDAAYFQRLGERVILRPSFRFYEQTAADFYHYRLDATSIVPLQGPPRPQGPFYSSDYRLSQMRTTTVGLKVVWRVTDALHLDASYERYEMRGLDDTTSQSAYPRADIWSAGAKFAW